MIANDTPPASLRCQRCAQPMKLVRRTQRLADCPICALSNARRAACRTRRNASPRHGTPPTSIENRQKRAAIWRSRRGERIGVFGLVCPTAGRSSRKLTMSTRAKAYNSAPGAGFARPGQRQNAPRVSSPSITPAQASSPRRSNDLADDSARRLPNRRNVKRKDDDELLELGERLASVQPKLISMLRWVDEVRDLVAMEVRRRGSWPEDTADMDMARRGSLLRRARMR